MSMSMTALRRDVRMVVDGLLGRNPPAVIVRPPSPVYPVVREAGSAARARSLEVVEVRRETPDALSLVLRDPAGLAIGFLPGQFFTVLVATEPGAEPLRRAYSASSSHLVTDTVTLTVKRIADGRVSSYLHAHAAPGMRLQVLGPSGEFTLVPEPTAGRHVVAIAGGSGITPIMSILRALLAGEPGSTATLLYGNRDAASIIFAAELDGLTATGRLAVRHVLEDPAGRPGATAGRLDAATVTAGLHDVPAGAAHYVCGPEAMMAEARVALTARAVPPALIREERFTAPARRAASSTDTAQPVTIRRGGVSLDVIVAPGATILDAGLAAGVPLKLSCAMGGCGACAVTLTAGEVAMDEPNCLTDLERARGTILACCARPLGPCTVEAAA